jgi:tetratricopeptide (TPR) repeat protein
MDIIERYLALVDEKRFAEGLPLIEEIVRRNPNMATSQFNYGICLEELGHYQDAAKAFLRAYELNRDDGGALYRGCLALAAAGDAPTLLRVFQQECGRDPEMIHNFLREERFARFWNVPGFGSLKNELPPDLKL